VVTDARGASENEVVVFLKRALGEDELIPGAKIVGGAMAVQFMGDACPTLNY
jgi:hypothetical protein